MKKVFLAAVCCIMFSRAIVAQSVSINNATADASAILDIKSTNKGFLMPRMTTLQRNAIAAPAEGLKVFDTDTKTFWFYNGTEWAQLAVIKKASNNLASDTWDVTGNELTDPAINFLGTIDEQPLRIRVNNLWAGEIHPTSGNVFLGLGAGEANTGAQANTAIGNTALASNTTGIENTAIGKDALYSNTTGYQNTANGYQALYFNTSGYGNTANGNAALTYNTTGYKNTANGYQALYNNSTGIENTANGYQALYSNTSGSGNTANGNAALIYNITGNRNTANGYGTLFSNTYGSGNTANGYQALVLNTTGIENTTNGHQSLYNNTTGYYNTANGSMALYSNTLGNNNTANGLKALYSNTTGIYNAANGSVALYYNTTGNYNIANGVRALYYNTTGTSNTANGYEALLSNTTGNSNTATGQWALYKNSTGNANTALGHSADVSSGALSNATAIGYYAIVNASNKVRIGNTSVTSIGGQVGWTNFSDGRIKNNIKENVPGLAFINLLKPVTYNFNLAKEYKLMGQKDSIQWEGRNDIEQISFTGFVAQDVETAAKKINYDFSGIDKTGKIMGLRYSEFVVPLVKAVQEQQAIIEALKKKLELQEKRLAALETGCLNVSTTLASVRTAK